MKRITFFLLTVFGVHLHAANVAYNTATWLTGPTNLHYLASNVTALGYVESRESANNFSALTNGSFATMFQISSVNCGVQVEGATYGGGWFQTSTNCEVRPDETSVSTGWFRDCLSCSAAGIGGGHASTEMWQSYNCLVSAGPGSRSQAYVFDCDACRALSDLGATSSGNFDTSTNCYIDAQDGGWGGFKCFSSSTAGLRAYSGFAAVSTLAVTNALFSTQDGSLLTLYATGTFPTGFVQYGSIASGVLRGNERFYAAGGEVGSLAMGRDIASTNNWTLGLHYTNSIPLSFAIGFNGATKFEVTSNGIATAAQYVVSGTTNQVVFGATNLPPSSTVAPTRWISVQVAGESTVYRLPLYQ